MDGCLPSASSAELAKESQRIELMRGALSADHGLPQQRRRSVRARNHRGTVPLNDRYTRAMKLRTADHPLALLSQTTVPAAPRSIAWQCRRRFAPSFSIRGRPYEQYAWGHDELRPLSKQPKDWYGESLLMTPVDSLDTLLLMGFNEEADKAKTLIVEKLSFDKDINVKNVFDIDDPRAWRSPLRLRNDRRRASPSPRRRPRHAFTPRIQHANRDALHVRQPAHRKNAAAQSNPAEVGTLVL